MVFSDVAGPADVNLHYYHTTYIFALKAMNLSKLTSLDQIRKISLISFTLCIWSLIMSQIILIVVLAWQLTILTVDLNSTVKVSNDPCFFISSTTIWLFLLHILLVYLAVLWVRVLILCLVYIYAIVFLRCCCCTVTTKVAFSVCYGNLYVHSQPTLPTLWYSPLDSSVRLS